MHFNVRFPGFPFWLSLLGMACGVVAPGEAGAADASRPRLAVLTDIGGDPDDQQSMVRLMVYANAFEIELLMATSAGIPGELKEPVTRPDLIREIVAGYAAVQADLVANSGEAGWPEAATLQAAVRTGNARRGRDAIGEGHDTDGSRRLIELIDAGTAARPLHISIWGGQTDLAQALWRVKHTRSEAAWAEFADRLRVYDIGDQDGLADWMRATFPGLHYVLSRPPADRDRRDATFRGMYLTGDPATTSLAWVERHVLVAGKLGTLYPVETWTEPNPHGCIKEGDTPSWFFFLPRGGNDPANPAQPGWGGRYRRLADGWWTDLEFDAAAGFDPRETVSRWREEFQADFARRLAWIHGERRDT